MIQLTYYEIKSNYPAVYDRCPRKHAVNKDLYALQRSYWPSVVFKAPATLGFLAAATYPPKFFIHSSRQYQSSFSNDFIIQIRFDSC